MFVLNRHTMFAPIENRRCPVRLDGLALAKPFSEGYFTSVNPAWMNTLGWTEDEIKAQTAATPRCIPNDGPPETGTCVRCDAPSAYGKRVLFGRAY